MAATPTLHVQVTSLPYDAYPSTFMISTELSSPANCQSLDTYNPIRCAPPGRILSF